MEATFQTGRPQEPISTGFGTQPRYIDIGTSDKGRVLVVVYTERGSNIRIVSCRKTTLSERELYEETNE